jgi:hypothetical protein
MATVYLARQLDLDRRVALKELRPQGSWDPSFARRFLSEAKLAGSFNHPNIVTVHDYFERDHVPYIAMEYLAGGSLRPYIGRLTLSQVGGVLEGLLAGLAQAERHEIVHRDIKPENVLVTNEGGIKIADFGIAKAKRAVETESRLTAVGTTLGTPNYIAPEQAMAQQLGPWTDLYSVGLMSFEMLVGRTPFGDSTEPMGIVLRQINEPLPRISDLVPSVPESISDWVGWLASKSPADRPQSAGQAWNALDEILLELLGPMWRKSASLVGSGRTPQAMAAPIAAPMASPAPRRSVPPTRVAADGAAAGVAAAGIGAAGIGAAGIGAAAMAATMPPRAALPEPVSVSASASAKRGPHRVPTAAKAMIAVAALLAAAAIALTAGKGAPIQTAADTPTPAASTAQPSPTQTANGVLADEAVAARQLAATYAAAAGQVSQQSTTAPLKSSNAPLVAALQKTARAYDAAATAAAAGDIAGYTTAMAAAENSKRELTTLLNGTSGGGLPASSPAPASTPSATSPPATSCGGDSQSDDPSDDACGPA